MGVVTPTPASPRPFLPPSPQPSPYFPLKAGNRRGSYVFENPCHPKTIPLHHVTLRNR